MTPKIARSAFPGDPTAVTSVTNHSIFIIWPQVKLLQRKRGFLLHKVLPQPQKWPWLAQNTPSLNHPKNSTSCSVRGSNSCYIGYQPLYFHQMTLSKVIRAQDGGSYITKWFPDHKNDLDWPKTRPATNTPKIAHSALPRDPTAVILANPGHFCGRGATLWCRNPLLSYNISL